MKSNWQQEVEKFRAWAATQSPQIGEWECNYDGWYPIYDEVEKFLAESSPLLWSEAEIEQLLYILARDWARGSIAHFLKSSYAEATLHLSGKLLEASDADARWQLADVLGYLPPDARIEPLLLRFMEDEEEYVRRRALQSLVRIGSTHIEQLALREWGREGENQEWARMYALNCWRRINSPLLEAHLPEAEASPFPYLSDYARRLRLGEAETD